MITETFYPYKDYIIRLRAVTGNGFWYSITKDVPNPSSPNGVKILYLRKQGFNFILPEELLNKAKNYIDNYPENLKVSYHKQLTKLTK